MSESNVPEVVFYIAGGRTVPALVLSAREGETSHLGAQGEPLLTIAIKKQAASNAPHKRLSPVQAATAEPELEIIRDVVHASHEFDAEFLKKHGSSPAQIAAQRGHGEWEHALILLKDAENVAAEPSIELIEAEPTK